MIVVFDWILLLITYVLCTSWWKTFSFLVSPLRDYYNYFSALRNKLASVIVSICFVLKLSINYIKYHTIWGKNIILTSNVYFIYLYVVWLKLVAARQFVRYINSITNYSKCRLLRHCNIYIRLPKFSLKMALKYRNM